MVIRSLAFILIIVVEVARPPFSLARAADPDKSGVKPESISLPTGPGSIEGLGRSPEPLLNTGAATYSIALEIPPAAAGHQPILDLGYSSLAGNSEYGIGWWLSVRDIRRQTDKGQPTFSDADTFIYQGEELVRLSDGSFRVENEGIFVRLRPLPGGGWEAHEKDGRVLRFGLYPSATRPDGKSRETGPSADGQRSAFDRTSRWLLDESVDVNGNLVEYEYASFADSPGRLYLDAIRYGLRFEDQLAQRRSRPHFAVRFVYEPRDDALSDYRTGYESRLGRRCKAIQVYAYPSPVSEPNGRLVRQYRLDFDGLRDGKPAQNLVGLSRLYAVEQLDGLGTPLPPIRLDYYDVQLPEQNGLARVVAIQKAPYISPSVAPGDAEFADIDGDGLPDLFLARADEHGYWRNLGFNRFSSWQRFDNRPGVPGIGLGQSGVTLLDIDGDGRVELVHRRGGGANIEDGVVFRRLEASVTAAPGGDGRMVVPGFHWGDLQAFRSPLSFDLDGPYIQQLDANSDKCIDLLRIDGEGVRVILNRTQEGSKDRYWNVSDVIPYGSTEISDLRLANGLCNSNSARLRRDPTVLFADMNGDRLLDLVRLNIDDKFLRVHVWPSRGNGRFGTSYILRSRTDKGLFDDLYVGTDPGDRLRLMDVNGDGLSDLVLPTSGIVRLWMNVGGRQFASSRQFAAPEYDSQTRLRQADMNGNGSVDLVWWNPSNDDEDIRLRYLDFCGEARSNLLRSVDNGQGKRVILEYRSSSDFYVGANEAGEPWLGTLPMPVWVVSKITTFTGVDLDGRPGEDRYIAQFFYRDGHYDGFEKEFRGFGGALRVDWAGQPGPGETSDPTPTRVTRYAYHTGAPDGLDNDSDRDRLRDAGQNEAGVYGTDEFNLVAGREEEPLKGKLLWSEVCALGDHFSPYPSWDRLTWLRTVHTGLNDGVDNDRDGSIDEPDERRFAHDDAVLRREFHDWLIAVLHWPRGGQRPIEVSTSNPLREVRFAYEGSTRRQFIEGPLSAFYRTTQRDAPAACVTKTEREYDALGNMTLERRLGIVEGRGTLDPPISTRTEFALRGAALANWIVDHPARIQIFDNKERLISEERRYYGDKDDDAIGRPLREVGSRGLLKRTEVLEIADTMEGQTANDIHWIDRERHRHDRYGNVVLSLDALGDPNDPTVGHARSIAYDQTYNTHPVLETHHIGKRAGKPVALRLHAAYDFALGKPIAATDFDSSVTSQQFVDSAYGRQVTGTRRTVTGHITRFAYDTHGRLTKIVRPGDSLDLPTQQFTYALADPTRGLVYAYTESGQLVGGRPTSRDWHPTIDGIELTIGSARSATISQSREVSGREGVILSIAYSDGLGRTLARVSEGEKKGKWIVQKAVQFDGRGQTFRNYQPFFGTQEANLSERISFFEHRRDTEGRLLSSTVPADAQGVHDVNRTEWFPLEERRFDEESCRDGKDGRPISLRQGRYKSLLRNGHDQLVEVREHLRITDDGEAAATFTDWKTRYEYDSLNDLTQVIDAQNNIRTFRFDSLKRRCKLDDPDRGITTFEYDDASNLVKTTDARGQSLEYTFDGLNRKLTETGIANGVRQVIQYHYDTPRGPLDRGDGTTVTAAGTAGRIAWVADLSGEEHFSYDDRGRKNWSLKRISPQPLGLPAAFWTSTDFDPQDRLTRLTYPDGAAVRYDYDARGLLATISDASQRDMIVKLSYEPSGKVQSVIHANHIITNHCYDDRTRMIRLTTTGPDQKLLIDYSYSFDGSSNITRITDDRPVSVVPEGDPRRNTQAFGYDDANRLTDVRYALGGLARNDGSIAYRYDRIGNMVSLRANGCVSDVNLGRLRYGQTRDRSFVEGQICGPHAFVSSESGLSLSYDARGNVIKCLSETYTWDAWNHQTSYVKAESKAKYVYDYQGRRASKATQSPERSQTIYYVNSFYEVDSAGHSTRHLLANDLRVGLIENNTISSGQNRTNWKALRHRDQDHIGSTLLISDPSGVSTEEFAYEPYGRVRHRSAQPDLPSSIKYRFAQKEEDSESGLLYFEARYLSNSLSRFTVCDSMIFGDRIEILSDPGNSHPYAYASNNPIKLVDSDGKFALPLVAIAAIILFESFDSQPANAPGLYDPVYPTKSLATQAAERGIDIGAGILIGRGLRALSSMRSSTIGVVEGTTARIGWQPRITDRGISRIESHLSQFGEDVANNAMISRLKSGYTSSQDINFYMHELKESAIMSRGIGAREAHLLTLDWQGIPYRAGYEAQLYAPEVIQQFPMHFSPSLSPK